MSKKHENTVQIKHEKHDQRKGWKAQNKPNFYYNDIFKDYFPK